MTEHEKESYKFDENSPVIPYKDGSFGFNYKNVEASVNALKNMLECAKVKVYKPSKPKRKDDETK